MSSSALERIEHRAGAIVAPHRRAEEAETHRLADDQAELRLRACRPRVPSSMPNGATHSADSGGGMPGTAGIALSTPT